MKTWVKVLLVSIAILIVVSAVPFMVYVFVHKPSFIEGAGTEDTWVAFWGSFLGGIISASLTAIVSYCILYRQQKENKRTLDYQIALQNYDSMKQACIDLLNAIDTNVIVDATNALLVGNAIEARDIIGNEYLKIKDCLTKFYIGIETFYCRDNDKADFSNECSALIGHYQSFLDIIQMLISIAANEKHEDYDINGILNTLKKAGTYDKIMLSKLQRCDKRLDFNDYSRWVTISSKRLLEYLDSSVEEEFSRYLLLLTGRFLREEKKKILKPYGINADADKD